MTQTPTRELLDTLVPTDWDSQKPGTNTGFQRVRWLQGVSDLVKRPVANRAMAIAAAVPSINGTGAIVSTGIGTIPQQPKRYAEFTVKARVTFNINSTGPAYVYVYRTLGAIPANGSAPNAGDVIVGDDSFVGGPTTGGVNQSGAFSYLDTGLNVNLQYRYYLAVKAPSGSVMNLVNNSQLLVMERS
jgi:hypothetical protein